MRVKITVLYDEGEQSLTRKTKSFALPTLDEDEISLQEIKDYLQENLVDAYDAEGFEMEAEDEVALGVDFAGAWVFPEPFDSKDEAKTFLARAIKDAGMFLADLE